MFVNSWIRIFGEAIGDFIVFFTAFFVVLNRDTMDPGTVGLALSFSLQVITLTLVVTMATEPEKKCYNQITVIPGVVFEFLTPPFHKKNKTTACRDYPLRVCTSNFVSFGIHIKVNIFEFNLLLPYDRHILSFYIFWSCSPIRNALCRE